MTSFSSLEHILLAAAEGVRPPERTTVSQAATKYRVVNNPGSYVGPWKNEITPYLVEPMDVLTSTDYTGMVFVGPAQSGKALALGTPIATPSGWATMGTLSVGDQIYGSSGQPCNVIFATDIMYRHECYEMRFDDNQAIIADAEHKWAVEDIWGASKTLTTKELIQSYEITCRSGKKRYRYAVPVAQPLLCAEKELPVDPYALGLWLGNGGRVYGYLTLFSEDAEEIRAAVRARNGELLEISDKQANTRTFGIADEHGRIVKRLEALGVGGTDGEKRIPDDYLRASFQQRMALLQGLMDTDGTAGVRGVCSFSTSVEGLHWDFQSLVASLGIKFHTNSRIPHYTYKGEKKAGRRTYRTAFSVYSDFECFKLARKQARLKKRGVNTRETHTKRRWIRSIKPVQSEPVRCIQVDSSDNLFLAGKALIPTHNTDMLINWITYSTICDPADTTIIEKSTAAARDFSRRRIDRLFRHSPQVGERLVLRKDGDNVLDKMFQSGMYLTLSWPSVNELSGKPIPRMWLTDYDRMPSDVDGEGSPFDLSKKRTTTFGRYGMTVAESSPGFSVENNNWMPATPHEAPPTRGILAIYNRGDRRRFQWRCPHCRQAFEPCFHLLSWPQTDDMMEAAECAVMSCPLCGCDIHHDTHKGIPGKYELNQTGRWIKDGQVWRPSGEIEGVGARSDIASFWLKGVCAGFADWRTLVFNYLKALQEFERTGSQDALKTTVNTDQGLPFTMRCLEEGLLPEVLKARATNLGEKVVPHGVRFLVATVDVQKSRFHVQIMGCGQYGDMWLVDTFTIRKSKRLDVDGHPWPVSPGSYFEDWLLLIPEVMEKSYPLADGSGRRMPVKVTGCDSGGKEGVTTNAYKFYRYLRNNEKGDLDPNLFRRFQLIKGADRKGVPRVQISYPDSQRKDRHAGARGDIPVLIIDSDAIKDWASKMLHRRDSKGGQVNFPDWLPDEFYVELTVEVRTTKGWQNPKNLSNESWDLFCYCLALCLSNHIRIEHIDWEAPPNWAADWDTNTMIFDSGEDKKFEAKPKIEYDLEQLARELA